MNQGASQKQDLTWIKTIFETYKRNLADDFYIGDKYKIQAADELLEEIKNFIKEANALVEKDNGKI